MQAVIPWDLAVIPFCGCVPGAALTLWSVPTECPLLSPAKLFSPLWSGCAPGDSGGGGFHYASELSQQPPKGVRMSPSPPQILLLNLRTFLLGTFMS